MPLYDLYAYALPFQFIVSPVVLLLLLFISAPYGKHNRKGWGPELNSRTAWLTMELPAVLTIAFMMLFFAHNVSVVTALFFVFWQMHYIYRTFIFTSFMQGSRKSFPLLLVVFAFLFNINNGFINGYSLFALNAKAYGIGWLVSPQCIAGFVLFFAGFLLHVHSDKVIRELRQPGETGYRIPMRGAFRFVSCPNYLGEIIQWFGWALMTWSLAGLAFAVFTFANLFPRAIANHRWYKANFKDYPAERKIILPGLF